MGSTDREKTEITIVIPNYNGIKYIDDCLKSVFKQTVATDVLVVDNGSTDGSINIIKVKYPQVRLIELGENTGFAAAVNIGIREARTEFIFLLNNDTVIQEDVSERLLKAIKRYPKAFSVSAKMLALRGEHLIDDTGDYYCALGWAYTLGKDSESDRYSTSRQVTSACAGAAMYKKSLLEEVGAFDDAHFCYLEDVDLGIRARIAGYKNYYEPTAIVYHAGSGTSGSRHNAFKVQLTSANNLYLIYKNMPVLMLLINLPLILLGIIIKQVFFVRKGLGRAHARGLLDGFKKIAANSKKHVGVSSRNITNYCLLQIELWINCVRRITGL